MMRRAGIVCCLGVAWLSGCGAGAEDTSSGADGTGVCVPSQMVSCACADGTASTQQCNATGSGFDPCLCAGAGTGGVPPLPPGTGGAPGTGGVLIGTGGAQLPPGTGGTAGIDPGTGGAPPIGTGGAPNLTGTNGGLNLPPVADYGALGPFTPRTIQNTGPTGQYTMVLPQELGLDNFRHPIATWGNGIFTTPAAYDLLLNTIASHGFVIIGSNSTSVNAQLMTAGLDWLIQQNTAPGELQGLLDPSRAVSIGYSLGGGAAVGTGSHPNVITTVSFHGLTGAAEALHGPLLLFAGSADTVVTPAGYVQPTYNRSTVQTFYTTLAGADHLRPLSDAGVERAPTIAWLRLWVYDDQDARVFFYGDTCTLCSDPWTNTQRKNWQ